VACLSAAACRDNIPTQLPPLDGFFYPVGLAVRQLSPDAIAPYGRSQLVVVSSNFDLRFDEPNGGTVLVVDPDASADWAVGGGLSVYDGGAWRMGSFGGEVLIADGACTDAWPRCTSACPPLLSDPVVAAGGAKLLFTSRANQTLTFLDMTREGSLSCASPCTIQLPIAALDPYGTSKVCSTRGGQPTAQAYVSQLRGVNNLGALTRLDLLTGAWINLNLGFGTTYTSVFNPVDDRLFITTRLSAVSAPLRWFNPLVTLSVVDGQALPEYRTAVVSNFVPSALSRDAVVSNDGRYLYMAVENYDYDTAVNTGIIVAQGGALVVLDLAPSSFNEPQLTVMAIVPTCLGGGQVRVLPPRATADGTGFKKDLVAVTCDYQGALVLYDHEREAVVRFVGLNPATGRPVLGREPFGLAVERIDPRRATVPVPYADYAPSPCRVGRPCDRIYVGSFLDDVVNILELDPDEPQGATLVKRIGRGPP
jgi:hypothetical protein